MTEPWNLTEITSEGVKQNFSGLLTAVEHDGKHVMITRYGGPVAVLVPVRWYRQALGPASELTRENPIQPVPREFTVSFFGKSPALTGEVRFTAPTDLLMRLLEEVRRREAEPEGRREVLNTILTEALSNYLGPEG